MSRPPRPPAPALERLTGDERGQLLGELLIVHPELVDEPERLALAKLAIIDVDEVAESLEYLDGASAASLGLTGSELYAIEGLESAEAREVTVRADETVLRARLRLDTPREREYLRHGGILPYVVRRLAGAPGARR